VSIVFFLLRFLSVVQTPVVSAAAVVEVEVDAATLRDARAQLDAIEAGPRRIRANMRGAQNDAWRASCVGQRLTEAQVHVGLAREEMQRLGREKAYALKRLQLLAQRTQEVERAARLCVEDELSTISASKLEIEAPTGVEARGDVTSPTQTPHPCPSLSCTVLPRSP
jgi:hypothetical protein